MQHVYERLLHGLFYRVYRLYLTALCNPFHLIDSPPSFFCSTQGGRDPKEAQTITNFVSGKVEMEGGTWRPKFQRGTDIVVKEFQDTLKTL